MANIKSAKKRILIIKRNTVRNRQIKNQINEALKAVAKKHSQKADLKSELKKLITLIDSAISKGVLHWKTAARKKSRLIKKFTKTTK